MACYSIHTGCAFDLESSHDYTEPFGWQSNGRMCPIYVGEPNFLFDEKSDILWKHWRIFMHPSKTLVFAETLLNYHPSSIFSSILIGVPWWGLCGSVVGQVTFEDSHGWGKLPNKFWTKTDGSVMINGNASPLNDSPGATCVYIISGHCSYMSLTSTG